MTKRWSIYIDVEGFGAIYERCEKQAFSAINELMEALYFVGSKAFPKSPERLFVHQFGDGFLVVSDNFEAKADRPLAIAISVMRHLIKKGVATKAAISGGSFSDVSSLYPPEVKENVKCNRIVPLGRGIMTIIPVMGAGLVSSYKLAERRKGAVLLLDTALFSSVPDEVKLTSAGFSVVDWVHSDFSMVSEICREAGLYKVNTIAAEKYLRSYIKKDREDLSKEWISSTMASVNIKDKT